MSEHDKRKFMAVEIMEEDCAKISGGTQQETPPPPPPPPAPIAEPLIIRPPG